jgi:hypothetical protein
MSGLMLFTAALAWDRFGTAAHHKASPAVLATPPAAEAAPAWDIVIGDGYIRGRTVITPNRGTVTSLFAHTESLTPVTAR